MAESQLCKHKYVLDLTQEQKDTLIGICTFHGWDIEFKEYKESEFRQVHRRQKVTNGTGDQSSKVEQVSSNSAAELSCSVQASDPSNRESSDIDKCPYCLSCPCVTLHVQSWLGHGRSPQPGNNLIRKKLYRKYWSMLDRRGIWSNPLYLERK